MKGLSRTLGLPMLIFYGTGMILGAGIYSIIGKAAALTGETLWLGFIFAGISAVLTALSYAELSTMFPKAGAEFVYLREAFKKRKWIGSTAGIAIAISGAATAATVALAFAGYLNQFVESPQALVALAVLIVFSGIAIVGIRESAWVTVISTLIEVGGLIFIIYLGMTSEKFGDVLSATPHLGTLSGSALIIFSFFGFENIVNLAEETKKPERDLPRAILISVLFSTILYVLVSISALALISLIGASRILYAMGEAKALPNATAKILPKRKTPWVSSLLVLFAAALLLSIGKLETVASVSSFATMLAFISVNIALIVLRYSQSSKKRSFRIPLSIGKFPIFPLLGAIICLVLLTQFEAKIYLIGGTLILLSALGFIWHERKVKEIR